MRSFKQWLQLQERGARTALSPNYPSLYHDIRQKPRVTWRAISATAPLADELIGDDDKVKDGGPNVTDKKDNPYKSFYKTESTARRRAMANQFAMGQGPGTQSFINQLQADKDAQASQDQSQTPQVDVVQQLVHKLGDVGSKAAFLLGQWERKGVDPMQAKNILKRSPEEVAAMHHRIVGGWTTYRPTPDIVAAMQKIALRKRRVALERMASQS